MLFFVSWKYFKKNSKKILPKRDYFIFDATEVGKKKLVDYKNLLGGEGFVTKGYILKYLKNPEANSVFKFEDKVRKFFKSEDFKDTLTVILKTLSTHPGSDDQVNVFVVFSNKQYKELAGKMKKAIMKRYTDVDFDYIFLENDLKNNKKLLKKDIKEKNLSKLEKIYKNMAAKSTKNDKSEK